MSLDRSNLAAAFNKPHVDRAAGLTGFLPATRPRRAITDPAPLEEPHGDALTVSEAKAEPSRPASVSPRQRLPAVKQRVSEQANIVTNVAVYLEPDLLDLVR